MGNSYNEYLSRVSHPTPTEDDGSLSFLGISTDRDRKSFSCEAKRQSDLVGESFGIVDYFPNIVVNGNEKYLYKEELRRLFFEIRDYIEGKMLLRIKSNWQIFPVDARGVDFLGYVFYHTHTKIRKKVKQNIKKKVVSCAKKGMSAKEIHKAVGSYQGWLNYGNTRNLIHKLNTIGNGKVFK